MRGHCGATKRVALGLAVLAGLWCAAAGAKAQVPKPGADPASALGAGVEQLRHALGEWTATTEFLKPDGSVARRVVGEYRFEWVVPDRVLQGRSEIKELETASGILFYVNERKAQIEMVSVGRDGQLWVMSGPVDGETRTTPPTQQADGTNIQLRFTRYNVSADRFESKMEFSTDGGLAWVQGNRQVFERRARRG
jgi:hypothetical protein